MRVSDEMSFRPACGPVQRAQGLHTSCRDKYCVPRCCSWSRVVPQLCGWQGLKFEAHTPRRAGRIGP